MYFIMFLLKKCYCLFVLVCLLPNGNYIALYRDNMDVLVVYLLTLLVIIYKQKLLLNSILQVPLAYRKSYHEK